MSYPNTGGFGAQQPNPQPYGQPPGLPAGAPPAGGKGLPFILNLVVLGLGVLTFLLGFAPYAKEAKSESGNFGDDSDSINFFANMGLGVGVIALALLLTAALIAAFSLLPEQKANGPVVAALSLTGFLTLLFLTFGIADGFDAGFGLILALVLSFIQAAAAITAALMSSGVIKPPAPRPYAPYPPQGGYPPPPPQPGYGAPQPGYPPPPPAG